MPKIKIMLNKIQYITNRNSTENFNSLKEVVKYVKSKKRVEYNYILQAREKGKKSEEYKKIKLSQIPCVVINFFHDKYINKNTIIHPTGYIYFDIDNVNKFDDLGIDTSYVRAYWKSLSNNGYSVVLKVNGLTPENLKESYNYIAKKLNIDYDKNAVSIDRLTILSYDPNAYYNEKSYTIDLTSISTKKNTHYSLKKDILLGYDSNGLNSITNNNFNEKLSSQNISIKYNSEGVFDLEKKLHYTKLFIPKNKINEGSREKFLSTITHQLIYLNKTFKRDRLYKYIKAVNQNKMNPPLEEEEVQIIFNKKYNNRYSLHPIENASKRILFNPDLSFTIKQKQSLTAITINKHKMTKSHNKIKNLLLNWDYKKMGKITILKTAKELGMNKKTVAKYYSKIIKENNILKNNTS